MIADGQGTGQIRSDQTDRERERENQLANIKKKKKKKKLRLKVEAKLSSIDQVEKDEIATGASWT